MEGVVLSDWEVEVIDVDELDFYLRSNFELEADLIVD